MPVDVVYPVGPGRHDAPAWLRWSIRSLEYHFPHDRLWVFGHCPTYLDTDRVLWVPTSQGGNKFANMKTQLQAIIDSEVSDEFLMMNDDFYFLDDISEVPMYDRGSLRSHAGKARAPYRGGLERCLAILVSWGYDDPKSCAVHVPMPVEKQRLGEVMERAWAEGHRDGFYRALYGAGLPSVSLPHRDPKLKRDAMPEDGWVFASSSPTSWDGPFGEFIRSRYFRPSTYEAS